MADKVKGLNDEEIKLALQELARFHATGFALMHKTGVEAFKIKFPIWLMRIKANGS